MEKTFNNKEKLAIMQIMIEIANHYSERFPNPDKLLGKFSKHLDLPTVSKEADLMPLLDAQTIMVTHVRGGGKSSDFENMLSTMLHASHYGVFNKNTKHKNRTPQQLITEWHYIFYSLLKGYIRPIDDCRIAFALDLLEQPISLSHYKEMDAHINMSLRNKAVETPKVDEIHRTDTPSKDITGTARRELKEELRREIKEEIRSELKTEIIKELKELLRKEIRNELQSGMKSFVNENFNETLYKDL